MSIIWSSLFGQDSSTISNPSLSAKEKFAAELANNMNTAMMENLSCFFMILLLNGYNEF